MARYKCGITVEFTETKIDMIGLHCECLIDQMLMHLCLDFCKEINKLGYKEIYESNK